MSPEQAMGSGAVDHRTDLYSVGVIMYKMLTGELPFPGANHNEILVKLLGDEPRPPHEVYPLLETEAEPIMMRLLSKQPENRFQTATELLAAIRQLRDHDNRTRSLSIYASGTSATSFAGGDLGEELNSQDSAGVAAEVLSEMRSGTQGAWVDSASLSLPVRRPWFFVGIGLIAAIAVVLALVLDLGGDETSSKMTSANTSPVKSGAPYAPAVPDEKSAAAPEEEPKEPDEDNSIEINITGIPKDAKIFYDDALVPKNPFRVEKKRVLVKLRVEAIGYEVYRYMVTPSDDQVVKVNLKRIALDEAMFDKKPEPVNKERIQSHKRKKKQLQKKEKEVVVEKPAAAETPKPAEKKEIYKEGKHGSVFVQDFE
jgi:hypothetical protein